MERKRILLYPGSFSPMHIGHLCLANYIIETQRDFDELWFLLTPSSPFKEHSPQLLPAEFRRRWAEHVIRSHPHLKLSFEEFGLPKPNYTYDTLTHLRENHKDCDFALLIGMDSLITLPRWYRSEELISETPIIVYPRPGYDIGRIECTIPDTIRILEEVPVFDISSTRIRRMIKSGHDLPYFLATTMDDPMYRELSALLAADSLSE